MGGPKAAFRVTVSLANENSLCQPASSVTGCLLQQISLSLFTDKFDSGERKDLRKNYKNKLQKHIL